MNSKKKKINCRKKKKEEAEEESLGELRISDLSPLVFSRISSSSDFKSLDPVQRDRNFMKDRFSRKDQMNLGGYIRNNNRNEREIIKLIK